MVARKDRMIMWRWINADHIQVEEARAQSASNAEELMKFKQLLDAGAITQEEYDAKKQQLLGL